MSKVAPLTLAERLAVAQHTLDDAELDQRSALLALEAACKRRQDAAERVFNLQSQIIDALRVA